MKPIFYLFLGLTFLLPQQYIFCENNKIVIENIDEWTIWLYTENDKALVCNKSDIEKESAYGFLENDVDQIALITFYLIPKEFAYQFIRAGGRYSLNFFCEKHYYEFKYLLGRICDIYSKEDGRKIFIDQLLRMIMKKTPIDKELEKKILQSDEEWLKILYASYLYNTKREKEAIDIFIRLYNENKNNNKINCIILGHILQDSFNNGGNEAYKEEFKKECKDCNSYFPLNRNKLN